MLVNARLANALAAGQLKFTLKELGHLRLPAKLLTADTTILVGDVLYRQVP